MGKLLLFMAALALVSLQLAAQLYPTSPLFWVASVAPIFTVLRVSLAFMLFVVLLHTPKHKTLRVPLGMLALGFTAWIVDATYNGNIGFIDSLTLLPAIVALDLALLESKPADEPFRSAEYVAAVRDIAADLFLIAYNWVAQFGWLLYMNARILAESLMASNEQTLSWLGTTHTDSLQKPKGISHLHTAMTNHVRT